MLYPRDAPRKALLAAVELEAALHAVEFPRFSIVKQRLSRYYLDKPDNFITSQYCIIVALTIRIEQKNRIKVVIQLCKV